MNQVYFYDLNWYVIVYTNSRAQPSKLSKLSGKNDVTNMETEDLNQNNPN